MVTFNAGKTMTSTVSHTSTNPQISAIGCPQTRYFTSVGVVTVGVKIGSLHPDEQLSRELYWPGAPGNTEFQVRLGSVNPNTSSCLLQPTRTESLAGKIGFGMAVSC